MSSSSPALNNNKDDDRSSSSDSRPSASVAAGPAPVSSSTAPSSDPPAAPSIGVPKDTSEQAARAVSNLLASGGISGVEEGAQERSPTDTKSEEENVAQEEETARPSRSHVPRQLNAFHADKAPSTTTTAFPASSSASQQRIETSIASGSSTTAVPASSSSQEASASASSNNSIKGGPTSIAISKTNKYVRPNDSAKLRETLRDFYRLLASLPIPIIKVVPTAVARALGRILASRGIMASNYVSGSRTRRG